MKVKKKPLPVPANRQGATIKKANNNLNSQNTPQKTISQGNSIEAQRRRVIAWLSRASLTTLEARQHLDVMHPAARVFELRQMGYDIQTVWVEHLSAAGNFHRVGKYILKR